MNFFQIKSLHEWIGKWIEDEWMDNQMDGWMIRQMDDWMTR